MRFSEQFEVGQMDELGRMHTPIHQLDSRAKILATAAFILVVMSFGRYEVSALMALCLFPLGMSAAGRIPARYLLRKVAFAAPFAVFVGIFNPMLDRAPMAFLFGWPVSAGWFSFFSILLRFCLTVSAALVLLCCTGIHQLCEGLERLGVPRVFVVQVLFLYRYFFVIADEGGRMLRGVEARSGEKRHICLGTYATLVGHLLLRSLDRAQRIYGAMVSRGFDGEIRVLRRRRPGWMEALFLGGWLLFFVIARRWNLAQEIGKFI